MATRETNRTRVPVSPELSARWASHWRLEYEGRWVMGAGGLVLKGAPGSATRATILELEREINGGSQLSEP